MIKQKYLCITYILLSNACLMANTHQAVFTMIYNTAVWGYNDKGEGFSGGGSLLRHTREYIVFLENFIKTHDIKTIVDAGCGDWEFSRYVNWQGARYIGYDVVAHVIEKNRRQFVNENISFVHGNLLTDDLPCADLLICKHVLQHLPNDDIVLFLKQLPKFKYCLLTNQVEPRTFSGDNADIAIGGGRKLDLTKPPFNLKGAKVLHYSVEEGIHQVFLIDNASSQ
jgi:SAM-dependent methyltransferase